MATTKVAISLDPKLLEQLDRLVAERIFRNRSQAVQDAVRDSRALPRSSGLEPFAMSKMSGTPAGPIPIIRRDREVRDPIQAGRKD